MLIRFTYMIFPVVTAALFLGTVAGAAPTASAATEHYDALSPGADEHGTHEGHGEDEKAIRLSPDELSEFGITVAVAGPGELAVHVSLPAEIVLNADRVAHVVPRVAGIVREVRKNLGDEVRKGEVMAILESRDLADSKAAFLASLARVSLAEANFAREENLWKKKISSEQEYLETRQALAEAKIELASAEQQLHTLGFSEEFLNELPGHPDVSFTRYEVLAPFDGTVIEKHIVLGEVLKDDAEAFVIADLDSVWVDIGVYQKDIPYIRNGLGVTVSAGHGIPDASGTISYIGPLVGEETRTALARVVLPNTKRHWRPGLFVTARVAIETVSVPVLIPKTALQTLENEKHVFVETADGFEARPVRVGRTNDTGVEIVSGIEPGERYVAAGGFTLKAEMSRGAFGDGHAH